MKRHLDLLRELMLRFEAGDYQPKVTGRTEDEIAYHVYLLKSAGLVDARVESTFESGRPWRCTAYAFHHITWLGHDFIDASRDDAIWAQALKTCTRPGHSMTFALLVRTLQELVSAERLKPLDDGDATPADEAEGDPGTGG